MIPRIFILGGLLLLAGCATAPMVPKPEVKTDAQRIALWQAHQARLKAVQHWQLRGRAAILAEDSGGQVTFEWLHRAASKKLAIRSPLGQNVLLLDMDAHGAVLVDHEGERYQGRNGQDLLRDALGWSVPVEAMQAWLLGLPASLDDSYILDEQGRIQRLNSQGWRIDYLRYTHQDGLDLPAKLELTHMDLTLRLVIDQWEL